MRHGYLYSGIAAAAIAFSLSTLGTSPVKADGLGDPIVARVGAKEIKLSELESKLLAVPAFQLRTFGKTEDEIRRNFLERVLVRDLLLAQGAVDAKLPESPDVNLSERAILRNAMLQQIRAEVMARPISDTEVKAYYEANLTKFQTPERVAIWRIVVATEADAKKVIEDLKKDGSVKRWADLARERSLDKATNMRGGNLGFVAPDGSTSESAVTVDKAILEAVARVKDAELVPDPVKEGDRWAVVWRRQTMKAVSRALEDEGLAIRQTIQRSETEAKLTAMLDDLHAHQVTDLKAELIEEVGVGPQGDLMPMKRPGVLPTSRKPASGPPQPNRGHDHDMR